MLTSSQPLVAWTDRGLYCAEGDFYIDPHRAVDHAVVTHAHSDHARRGSQNYYCESSGVGLLKTRLGKKIQVRGIPYREPFILGRARVSFHSAGHILGSAQVRIELLKNSEINKSEQRPGTLSGDRDPGESGSRGLEGNVWVQNSNEVWVVSGDYKREKDPSCEPFEVVPCDTFITEATFGTPKYVWNKNQDYGQEIYNWWKANAAVGKNSLLFCYSLGKSQRILAVLAPYMDRPVLIDPNMVELTECYRQEGKRLALTQKLERKNAANSQALKGELILAPPSILKSSLLESLGAYETAFVSGWMVDQSFGSFRGYQKGFVMSDHADWDDLNETIQETGAKRIFVLHRSQGSLVRHLRKLGLEAYSAESLEPKKYQDLYEVNLPLFQL